MSLHCKHCGIGYVAFDRHDGFCCSGCAQVYTLIQDGGMEDYYALQDRIGKPPVHTSMQESLVWARQLQKAAEAAATSNPSLIFSVQGMTCIGCAWLVEKVLRTQPGVRSVRVDLEAHIVSIEWIPGEFSLQESMRSLRQFGYVAIQHTGAPSSLMSPLLWRICLCFLFTINTFLLSSLAMLEMDLSAYSDMLKLLEWLMSGLVFMVGASFFLMPTYQSLRMGRWHHDGQLAIAILLSYLGSVLGWIHINSFGVCALVTLILFARWWHRKQWSLQDIAVASIDPRMLLFLQVFALLLVAIAVGFGTVGKWELAACILIAGNLYPLAHSVSYRPSSVFAFACATFSLLGVLVACVYPNVFFATAYVLLTGTICNFLFFRFSMCSYKPLY